MCLLVFLRGVKDPGMRIKLGEASLQTFNDAIKLARRLEKVEITMKTTTKSTNYAVEHDYQSNCDTYHKGKTKFIFCHKKQPNRIPK